MDQLSVLKLFKGYIGEKTDRISPDALRYGLVMPDDAPEKVLKQAIKLYGKDGQIWNETFHKSWQKVADAPIEDLVFEQIIHYLTTYGFDEMGIFSHETVYVPYEKLDIPELQEDIELMTISAYSKKEVSDKLMSLLTSGIALSKDTIGCIIDLKELIDLDRFEQIKNKEAMIALCDALSVTPEDPDEFLRYVIYKTSGSTLKIQDQQTLSSLKMHSRKQLLELFERYLKADEQSRMKRLASVFFRNRKLFLAMKTAPEDVSSPQMLLRSFPEKTDDSEEARKLNHLINRIRKKADECHRPLPLNRLDRLSAPSTKISDEELLDALNDVTVYREIRILNGLSYVLKGDPSIVYRIRNGRSFATKREQLDHDGIELIAKRHRMVLDHLISRLKPSLAGKRVCLNEGFAFKAPTSEKQFVSHFPCASSFEMKRDSAIVFGIHWTNVDPKESEVPGKGRVDLDLHMQDLNVSYGWNSAYRSDDREILYSGDMTDAPLPKGASELFHIAGDIDSTFVFTVNKYTYNDVKIPYEIVLAKAKDGINTEEFENGHVLDPNDIILTIPMEMEATESMTRVGMVCVYGDTVKVIFDSFNGARMIVSDSSDPVFMDTFNYLKAYQETALSLEELLTDCGAKIIRTSVQDQEDTAADIDYDLRLDSLTRETIIDLLRG